MDQNLILLKSAHWLLLLKKVIVFKIVTVLIYLFILYLLLLKHDIKSSVIVQWDSEITKNIFSSPLVFHYV